MRATCVDHVDLSPDSDLDRVALIVSRLAEKVRRDDLRVVFGQLVALCWTHPAKAAQLLVCAAVWNDPIERATVLIALGHIAPRSWS